MLGRVPGIRNLEFDTLGSGYFEAASKEFEPTVELLQAALDKKKVRGITVARVAQVELDKAIAKVELSVAGVS